MRFPQVLLKVYLTLHAQHRNGDIVGYVSLFSFPNKLTWHQMALKNLYIQEPTSILPLKGLPTMGHVRTLLLDPDFTKYSQTFAGRMTIDYGLCLLRLKSPGTTFVSGSVHLRWMYKYCIDLVYPNYKVKRDSVYDHPIPYLEDPKYLSFTIVGCPWFWDALKYNFKEGQLQLSQTHTFMSTRLATTATSKEKKGT